MQTPSASSTLNFTKQKVVTIFRSVGWVTFWVELGLAVASALALLFAISGRNFSTEVNTGISIGIFWAICAAIGLCLNLFIAFRYTRIAKGLRNPNPDLHPKKADTLKLLRFATLVSLVGIFLSLLGAGATIGVLVAKAVSQPPGVTITDPNRIIRALDVFVAVANLNILTAHFVGVVTPLGLLSWLNHTSSKSDEGGKH